MTTEEKYNLAMEILSKADVPKDRDVALSIAEGIKDNKFLIEYLEGKVVLFLTFENNLIDGKRYIFINNCWIAPNYRSSNRLIKVRNVLKFLFKDVYKFYWFNREKQKMIYRS